MKRLERPLLQFLTPSALILLLANSGCATPKPPPALTPSTQPLVLKNVVRGLPPLSEPPSTLLDLRSWRLSLPVGEPHQPTQVDQPALSSFKERDYFYASSKGVVFRAYAGGVTAPTSNYPHTELREMMLSGREPAAWSTTEGRHTMAFTAAITHTPIAKPHVVTGQLYDTKGDVVAVRLEREHLFVEAGGNNLGTLETNYKLGTTFSVTIDASEGRVRVYYNGAQDPRVDVERKIDGCYFKAGVYTQSNTTKGDAPDAYGEVILSELSVQHVE